MEKIFDDGDWRYDRLCRVEQVYDIQKESYGFEVKTEIIHLYDHEGMLEVLWKKEPSEHEKWLIEKIWELQNEPAMNVEHKVDD